MNQNSLFLILAAPACAWVAGMGLFKTLLVLICMHRYIDGGQFSGPLGDILENNVFFAVVGVLGAVELIVDFIPRWDIAWHRWNGHLRVAGAVALTWYVLHSEDVSSRVIMCVVGAALAITSYTATTSARKAAIRGSTGAFVSPISLVTEECMIAATLLPLTKLPPMTLLMVAFMAGASLLIIYVIKPEARETMRWLFTFKWVRPEAIDTSGGNN